MTAGEALRALCEAWERADVEGVVALFAEDGVYEDPLFPEPLRGHAAMRETIAAAVAELTGTEVKIRNILDRGDLALAEGEFQAALADGTGRLDFRLAMVAEVRDGRIARFAEYFDTKPLS